MTSPIDPEDLRNLQAAVEEDDELDYVLASHAWHRARVQVTDEDIRREGLSDPDLCVECPQLIKWLASNGMESESGFGICRSGGGKLVYATSAMSHDHIINRLAEVVGRAPLDVLDEIAAAGEWTWRLQGCTIDEHAAHDGMEFSGVQLRSQYGMPGEEQGCVCVAVPKTEASIGDRVLYHGGAATVLNTGSQDGSRVLWLRSEVDRGSLRVGSEFQADPRNCVAVPTRNEVLDAMTEADKRADILKNIEAHGAIQLSGRGSVGFWGAAVDSLTAEGKVKHEFVDDAEGQYSYINVTLADSL